MAGPYGGLTLAHALREEGLAIPAECSNVELLMPVHGVLTLRYDVPVLTDDLPKITRALERFAAATLIGDP